MYVPTPVVLSVNHGCRMLGFFFARNNSISLVFGRRITIFLKQTIIVSENQPIIYLYFSSAVKH